ncbi:MAG: FHA domain-containing protein [Bifidobacteriaceae bacterium]|nr:FHA domain-containing protein [Bifidobacteriaceae bacterium]MCI1914965.1 FHA domain-containing protein [Bifidobacteriaceae bacterium]
MSDTNVASLGWIVKVLNTGREYHFNVGDSVVIGRTPLRPSALGEADRRLDIDDPEKSMSKRHALFTVRANGSASIHDLHSTNGTYIVRDDGELMRLPLEQDYTLTRPTRLQLGDVGVEIHREVTRPGNAVPPSRAATRTQGDDLFSHAAQPVLPEGVDSPSLSVDQILDLRAGEPTEMFNAKKVRQQVLGMQNDAPATSAQTSPETVVEKAATQEAEPAQPEPEQTESVQAAPAQTVQPEPAPAETEQDSDFATMKQDLEAQSRMQRELLEQQPTDQPTTQQPQPTVQPQSQPAAVFEPGSVFDRLTSGELNSHVPAVQIGELTSDDAQRTSDQTAQFEMAKHHELLPFLALNPHLYDDLYAWLEAIGDPDIDAALRSNTGYTTYREGRN